MWHVVLQAAPKHTTGGASWRRGELAISTLSLTASELQAPLPVTFETAIGALEQLPQMFCEPDGWFDWTSPPDQPRWQISGQLHDRGDALSHVEVKFDGAVSPTQLDAFLSAFGWPERALVFQLAREGVYLDEARFRELF